MSTLLPALLCSMLASCTFVRETVEPAMHEVTYLVFGTKQTIQLEPEEAKQLAEAAFEKLDAQIPDNVTPETFVVVDATALRGPIDFLDGQKEKLEVHLEDAPDLLKNEINRLAAEKGWAPITNAAVEAAARQCGYTDVAAALYASESRKELAAQLGKERSGVAQQVLYADLLFFQDAQHGARAQLRLTLRCASVSGRDEWLADHTIDKSLPFRGLLNGLKEWAETARCGADSVQDVKDTFDRLRGLFSIGTALAKR